MSDLDFHFTGFYDLSIFNGLFIKHFSKSPHWRIEAATAMPNVVYMINHDSEIKDVRWAAYLLATVLVETTNLFEFVVPLTDRKGRQIIKNGVPQTKKLKKWLFTMEPVEEVGHGQGRAYHEAVKVASLADGSVRVTEQDGDQFKVSPIGVISNISRGAKLGSPDGGPVSRTYEDDPGEVNAYFGRGYVQLTWWSNYAKSSVALGRGLELLLHPDRVLQPETAYTLMSHGMRTGFGFANGHKFTDFFSGRKRDYKRARRMVNGTDRDEEIAKIAITFESILMESRMWVAIPPGFADGVAGAPSRWR